ncbi:MAG: beta-lactamase domain protein [Solirubrobacterales bacterium]|nr:beta-lactamase domain protein [Solirubrobacterales bacterium]
MSEGTPSGIHRLSLSTPFAIGRVNAYLLEGDPLTLVDPGPHMRETRDELEAGLRALGHELEDVEVVFLTHQHHDHIGLAHEVVDRSGAQVAVIEPLARYLADYETSMDRDDAYAVEVMHRHGVPPDVTSTLNQVSLAFRHFAASVGTDRVLADGERARLGGRDWTVHTRPGHSPTDTILYEGNERLVIGGDHLLEKVSSNPVAHVPIDAEDPVAAARAPEGPGPLRRYLASMRETAAMDVDLVLPGHGEPFTDHRGLVTKRARMHRRRAEKILRETDEAVTAVDIARTLWRRVPVAQQYLALSEVLGHLDLLAGEGRVAASEDGGVVRWQRT